MQHIYTIDVALQDYAGLTQDEIGDLAHRVARVCGFVVAASLAGAAEGMKWHTMQTCQGGAISTTIKVSGPETMKPHHLAVLGRALSQVVTAVVDPFMLSMEDREPRPNAITRIEKIS